MKRSIVISGSQGCGKTTLARDLEKDLNIPYRAVETKSCMPEGITSHLDVLRMAVLEPSAGIQFQEDLILKRAELFESLKDEAFVSDRACFDSFVYYTLHNSMFDAPEHAEMLYRKTVESVKHHDLLVYLNTEVSNVDNNGVRVTSPYYQVAINHTLREIVQDTYKKLYGAVFCMPGQTVEGFSFELFFAIIDNKMKYPVLFIHEPYGFRYSEHRLNTVKNALNMIDTFRIENGTAITSAQPDNRVLN